MTLEGTLTRLGRDLGVTYGSRGHLALPPASLRATKAYPHQGQPIRASDRPLILQPGWPPVGGRWSFLLWINGPLARGVRGRLAGAPRPARAAGIAGPAEPAADQGRPKGAVGRAQHLDGAGRAAVGPLLATAGPGVAGCRARRWEGPLGR